MQKNASLKDGYEQIIGFLPEAIFIFSAHTKEITLSDNQKRYISSDFNDEDSFGALGGKDRVVAAAALAKIFPKTTLVTTSRRLLSNSQSPSHAQVVAQELIDEGINQSRIVKEEKSFNLVTQIAVMLELVLKKNWKKIAAISSDYQIPRLVAIYNNLEKLLNLDPQTLRNFHQISSENRQIVFVSADNILNFYPPLQLFSSWPYRHSPAYQKRVDSEQKGVQDILNGRYRINNTAGKDLDKTV